MNTYYEDYFYEPDHCCRQCDEKDQVIDESEEFLDEIVQQLYSKESLNKAVLQHCLEELCFRLKVKLPMGELQVDRKKSELFSLAVDLAKNHAAMRKCI